MPRLLVAVAEDDELELRGGERVPAALGQPVELALRICRGEATTGEPSCHWRSAMHIAVPGVHGTGRSVARSGFISKSP